ncbi:MAG: polysaccharide biosynthesis protein [Clostridia bacterium]|nr:polysaccharide biosynthesis protein [Clostridia bacterium]MDD4387205.1 polysaccharide biosynthesis protein [Clostridia bacterium]
MKKVMFVSSSGGHLTELLKLQSLFTTYEYMLVTEKTITTEKLIEKYNVRYMKYGSRQYIFSYFFVFIFNILKSIVLILTFKPNLVITTGAHTGGIVCFIAKLFGKKVIYIESMAKVNTLSMTGRFVYLFADKFYVQWEELEHKYKKSKYLGRLR